MSNVGACQYTLLYAPIVVLTQVSRINTVDNIAMT